MRLLSIFILTLCLSTNAQDFVLKTSLTADTVICKIDSINASWLYYKNQEDESLQKIDIDLVSKILFTSGGDKLIVPRIDYQKIDGTISFMNLKETIIVNEQGDEEIVDNSRLFMCAFQASPNSSTVTLLKDKYQYDAVKKEFGEPLIVNIKQEGLQELKDPFNIYMLDDIVVIKFKGQEKRIIRSRTAMNSIELFHPVYNYDRVSMMLLYDKKRNKYREVDNLAVEDDRVRYDYLGKYQTSRSSSKKTDIYGIFLNDYPIVDSVKRTLKNSYKIERSSSGIDIDKVAFGIGHGLEFAGAIGANIQYYPVKYISVFAAFGHAVAGTGYNLGIKSRYMTDDLRIRPYITYMYGYNYHVIHTDLRKYNRIFYGHSIAAGIDTRPKFGKAGYWTFGLTYPFTTTEAEEYVEEVEKDPDVQFKNKVLPFGFTIGYKIILGR